MLPVLLFCFFGLQWAGATVVGIDFGNEFLKVGLAAPGRPFEIVLNVHSNRKTPAAVSFVEQTRAFGDAALSHTTKEPSDVLQLLPELLALNVSTPDIIGRFLPLDVQPNEARGSFGVSLKKRDLSISAEEIVANVMQFMQKMVSNFIGAESVKLDAVVAIPTSFNMRARQALLSALKVAHVNPLAFVRQTPAAALYHSRDLAMNFTGNKLFLNMGAWRTQSCVVHFHTSKKKSTTSVINCEETTKIGGRHFDVLLADLIMSKVDETLPPRALQRIFRQAQKTKLILSTNKRADVFIESLSKDKDFRTVITRVEFEALVAPSLADVSSLVARNLANSNLSLSDLVAVEVIGGGWRVPRVQQAIEELIKPHELGQHVNGDEGVALGSALIAANASSAFRINGIQFSDPSPYGYYLQLKNVTKNAEWKQRDIIKVGGKFGGFRTVSNRGCHDLEAKLFETDGKISTLLTTYQLTGIEEGCQTTYKEYGSPKTSIVFSAPPTGIVSVDRVVTQWEEKYLKPEVTTTTTPAPNATDTTTTTTGTPKMTEHVKKHTMKTQLTTTEALPRPLNSSEILMAVERLAEFNSADNKAQRLAFVKNSLESFIYASRSDLRSDTHMSVSLESERESIMQQLEDAEDWLYEDGMTASIEAVEGKLKTLKALTVAVNERAFELVEREKLAVNVESVDEQILIKLGSSLFEEYDLNETRVDAFKADWSEFKQWFADQQKTQKEKTLTEAPVFKAADVQNKLGALGEKLRKLLLSATLKKPAVEVNATTPELPPSEDQKNETKEEDIPTPAPRRKEFSKSDEL